MAIDRRLAYAIKWFAIHENAILDRYFQFCPYQDWEDFQQDILIYIHNHRRHIRLGNRGWKSYIVMTIMCRLRNRVRDSINRVKKERRSSRNVDTIADTIPDVASVMDVTTLVCGFKTATRHYMRGLTVPQVAIRTKGKKYTVTTNYQRVLKEIKRDIRAVREAIYA